MGCLPERCRSHYRALGFGVEVREWRWPCNAGVHVARIIMANGDSGADLDAERWPETVQGTCAAAAQRHAAGIGDA